MVHFQALWSACLPRIWLKIVDIGATVGAPFLAAMVKPTGTPQARHIWPVVMFFDL
jgi:hypothetical protein